MLIMPTWLVTGMLKTPKVQAAESGLKNGTVFTDVPGIGNDPWSNPSMAQLSDNQYATATISGSNNRTHYLKSTGFNFNIPNGTLIKGIELKLEKHQECTSGTCTSNVTDSTVSLVKNGLVTGSNLAESTSWGTSDSTSTYGGATNLWGSVWTNSDINNVNFGSVISATRNSGRDRTVSIDSVTMKVYYDDISAPVIETHSNVLAEATSMSGAVVNYTAPNTNDNVDGVSPAVCSPASGSTFVLGMTTVNCTKEDIAGNDAIPTFFFVNVQDTVKPVVTGVQSGWHYNHSVTPTFSDATTITALLNGVPFTSGTTVSEVGSYDLIVADLFGNSTGINFWINPLSQTTEINTVPQDVVSIDGNLKVIGIQTNSGLGTITIEKYNGEPKKEGSTIGANGFYYNITTTGDIKFPIQIELSYSDATSESNYLDETKFVSLYYFDGTNWKDYQLDIDPSSVSLDKENNKIIASLKHLTPIVPVIDVSAPDSPVLTSKIVIGKTIKLDWNRVDGAKFYYVYVSNQAISESQYIRKDVIADPATHDEINVGALLLLNLTLCLLF